MSVEEMRREIAIAHNGDGWKYRVSKMRDEQVIAIYYSFLKRGKFNPKKNKPQEKKTEDFVNKTSKGVQLSFDDILMRA